MDPSLAISTALEAMTSRVGSDGGAIAITKYGVIGHAHNSRKMTWASIQGGKLCSGVETGNEFSEDVQ
jgi:isoaspartyl peptidase/L-asparaginase-like protein (Ntn-hydrolase superfamily)